MHLRPCLLGRGTVGTLDHMDLLSGWTVGTIDCVDLLSGGTVCTLGPCVFTE